MAVIKNYKELIVYQKGYNLAMRIFEITQTFPKEERYALTDQIRRSSRSITANIAESWAKRLYIKHFISKLTDSLAEEYETEGWLDYAKDCKYINEQTHNEMIADYLEVRKLLQYMIRNAEQFTKK